MAEGKSFLIIDANALIHRAFYALPALSTKKGELVNAIYGFLLVLFKAIRELKPDFIAAAFDLPSPTFRHKKFEEYKAKRPRIPEELSQQISKVKEVLKSFNIPVFEKQGYEADDIIGTLSKRASQRQVFPTLESIILSGDLDTLQLVDKQTKVYTFKKGIKDAILYDEKAVKERYGLSPSQLVDFKALKGDPSDNIPGVPGIGEKTAARLIKQFGTLENLYSALAQEKKNSQLNFSLLTKLKKYKDQAFFSKMLVEIKRDVPFDFNIKECRLDRFNKKKARAVLKNFEFYSLIDRLKFLEEKEENSLNFGKKENLKIW
jgi:DNA polymerase-1